MALKTKRKKRRIGWRERVGLPELGIARIKAKVDTGARTSALHAFNVKPIKKRGVLYVEFAVHPVQRRRKPEVACVARVLDQRRITDSGGNCQMRYVIRTRLKLGTRSWPIELTLSNRDAMGFRMLLGREAIRRRFLVDPAKSYVASAKKKPATSA
jgi:hypothetical protein